MTFPSEPSTIPELLSIDPVHTAQEIEQFVQCEVKRLNKRGIVLGLSGGLDSSVCAYLCVRALGQRRVHTYILPERDSNPDNTRDADRVAEALGLQPIRIDLTPMLAQTGLYDLVPEDRVSDRRTIEAGIRWVQRITRQSSAFGEGVASLYNVAPSLLARLSHPFVWRATATIQTFIITKVRLRMLVLYYHALQRDCLVAGTTDKSEWSIGFYDKYGDGANDVALLRHLYKTQIRQLARFLDVPAQIVDKPSSGDLAAGLPNEAAIGMTYAQLDGILWGIEHGLDDGTIMAQAGVSRADLRAVRKAMRVAQVREEMPKHL